MAYKMQICVLFISLMYIGSIVAYTEENFMVMDATEGTTPAVCTPNMTCAFQQYEEHGGVYHYYPVIPYCHCPEDYGCIEDGQNMRREFFYYVCKYVGQ